MKFIVNWGVRRLLSTPPLFALLFLLLGGS